MIDSILEPNEFEGRVCIVTGATRGIGAAIAHQFAGRGGHIVVTDIDLGLGPNGWEIARRARDHFPNAPVIYITGKAAGDYEEEGVPESRILEKPFHIDVLVDMISSVLN